MPPCSPWNCGRGTEHRKSQISMARNERGNRMSAILLDESPQRHVVEVILRLGQAGLLCDSPCFWLNGALNSAVITHQDGTLLLSLLIVKVVFVEAYREHITYTLKERHLAQQLLTHSDPGSHTSTTPTPWSCSQTVKSITVSMTWVFHSFHGDASTQAKTHPILTTRCNVQKRFTKSLHPG